MSPETVSAVESDSLGKAMLQPYHWQAGQTCSLHPPWPAPWPGWGCCTTGLPSLPPPPGYFSPEVKVWIWWSCSRIWIALKTNSTHLHGVEGNDFGSAKWESCSLCLRQESKRWWLFLFSKSLKWQDFMLTSSNWLYRIRIWMDQPARIIESHGGQNDNSCLQREGTERPGHLKFSQVVFQYTTFMTCRSLSMQ